MRNWGAQSSTDYVFAIARRLRTSQNTLLLVMAIILGVATGLAIWLFREAITFFSEFTSALQGVSAPIFGPLGGVIILALAGAVVGWIMQRFVGEERHHGVAGVMESVALAGGRLPYEKMPFKAVASALSLGAGASVGPEDPSVQIGSNLGSFLGHVLKINEDMVRLLVAAGAASAVSAAFGAPIAGVFFAIEVVLNGAFETRSFGIIVLASVMASAVMQAIESAPEMGPFNYALSTPLEIPLFIPMAVIIAGVSILFVRSLRWQHDLWHHYVHLPRPARTALAGALVGLIGIFLPQILGIGRETMRDVLSGEAHFSLLMVAALAFVKILATSISMAGGFVGGIFAPSLFVGTMIGNFYGQVVERLLNSGPGTANAYAIVGMAATMAGVVRSPITAIMLVFELTNDYRLILPIMLATVICVYVAERFERHGLYTRSLLTKGVHLPQGRETDLMQGITVGEAMLKPAPSVPHDVKLAELQDRFTALRSNSLCVLDADGKLYGIVTIADLHRAMAETEGTSITVGDICTRDLITINPEQPVWEAIRTMILHDIGRVPVVERGTNMLVGLIGRHGVVRAYNVAIARKFEDQHFAEHIRLNALTSNHIVEYFVASDAPIVNKRIREIAWPTESAVVAIRRDGRLIVPHGNTDLRSGDSVTLLVNRQLEDTLKTLFSAVASDDDPQI